MGSVGFEVINSVTVDKALRKAQPVISKRWVIIIYVAVRVADEKWASSEEATGIAVNWMDMR